MREQRKKVVEVKVLGENDRVKDAFSFESEAQSEEFSPDARARVFARLATVYIKFSIVSMIEIPPIYSAA